MTNLTGVIAALVGLKVVDFLYYIASQQNFTQQAGGFILTIQWNRNCSDDYLCRISVGD